MPPDNSRPNLQEICRQCPTQTFRSRCPHTVEGRECLKRLRQTTPESSVSTRPLRFSYWSPLKSSSNTPPYNDSQPSPVPAYRTPENQTQFINAPHPPSSQVISFHQTHNILNATTVSTLSSQFPPTHVATTVSSQFPPTHDATTVSSQFPPTHGYSDATTVSSQVISNPSFPPTYSNSDATTDLTSLTVAPSTSLLTATFSSPTHIEDSSDIDEETPHTSGYDQRGRRVRITKKNAVYGKVEGAMRGSKPYDILRMKELRPPITEQPEATARFLRCTSDIIERCERLSQETGCWLHFSAQHLFAHGGFFHYTSPRLLREAKKDAEQIINHMNQVYATLIAARNEESKEMHKRLMLADEATAEAECKAEAAQRERDLQNEEIEAQRLELQALKAKLKLAEKRNNTLQ